MTISDNNYAESPSGTPAPTQRRAMRDARGLFSRLFRLVSCDLAIDLGTVNTLIYIPGEGVVLDEPSVVALIAKSRQRSVLAVGTDARAMVGRQPGNIETITPMRDGVIADFIAAEEMIKTFISTVKPGRKLKSARIMICVPTDATPVEQRAVFDAALAAGARKVYLIDEPVAAAIGAGLPIFDPHGIMIVDIGGGTTEIAVLSLGGIIYSRSLRVAGNAMDEAIIDYVRDRYHLQIGESRAEDIKKRFGSALQLQGEDDFQVTVKGHHLGTRKPGEASLSSSDLAEALSEPLNAISKGIERALEELAPELASDVADGKVLLTGGGALLAHLDRMLANRIGVSFQIANDPLQCVVKGTGKALENIDEFEGFLVRY